MGEFVSLETLAASVRDGMSLAIPTDHAGVAMAATAAIDRQASEKPSPRLRADQRYPGRYADRRRAWSDRSKPAP